MLTNNSDLLSQLVGILGGEALILCTAGVERPIPRTLEIFFRTTGNRLYNQISALQRTGEVRIPS